MKTQVEIESNGTLQDQVQSQVQAQKLQFELALDIIYSH